ncbi:MAG TPA: T9SS type A sorting domain-containing protein [Bacteroidia bacterium]
MKKIITTIAITLAFIGLNNKANAQTPTWAWAKDTTGGSIAIGGMTTDASGNIYVANPFGNIFLVKYDNTGTKIWAKSATGAQNNPPATQTYPNGIALDPSGNILVTGFFTSATMTIESTVLTRVSTVDMFVAKYDPTGNLLWAKSEAIGNVGNVGYHVASDALGNVIVVGSYSAPTMTIGTTAFTNPCTYGGGCPSMLVVKYDGTNGAVLWAKSSFASIGTSYCYSVATDASNNIYVGGDFSKNGTRNSIVKYNSIGDTLWTQANGGWHVTIDAAGNLYSGYDGLAGDGLVKKYNSNNGAVLWTSPATGNADNSGVCTTTDGGGNVYYFGKFRSTSITFGTYTLTHAGTGADDDFFIVKYDNTGTVLWAIAVGGTSWDALNGAATDVFGNVFVGGFSLSPTLTFGTTTLTILGAGYNVFFARLGNLATGFNELSDNSNFNIYPNPANSIINLELKMKDGIQNTTLLITDMLGNTVKQSILYNPTSIISVSDLAEGVYNISLISNEGVVNKRLVIVR